MREMELKYIMLNNIANSSSRSPYSQQPTGGTNTTDVCTDLSVQ